LSEGDDADKQRAEKLLKQASEALTPATRGKPGVATVVTALTAEVEKLDETITVTKQHLNDLRQDQLHAARFLWADRLDKAAQDFANVAAQLSAAEKALGRYSSLQDLYLPLRRLWVGNTLAKVKSVRRQTRSLSSSYWLRDHLCIAAAGGDALPSNRNSIRHQTCSAQLVFWLFAFGVPPLKALKDVASSKSGTHGTPVFAHLRISIPLAPFHSVNLQRERTRQVAPDLRRFALTSTQPAHPALQILRVLPKGSPLHGLSDSRTLSS